jgi:mannose/fructose/N-acetylgalactosamine-specific phosphotransferase system component IIC
MIKKLHAYLTTHGMMLMVIGFAIAAGGLLVYLYNMNNLHYAVVGKSAYIATFTGFSIYLIGRIYVAVKRHRDKVTQQRQTPAEDADL